MHSKRVFQMWRANCFEKCERYAKRESRTLGICCIYIFIYTERVKNIRAKRHFCRRLRTHSRTQKSFTQYNSDKKAKKKIITIILVSNLSLCSETYTYTHICGGGGFFYKLAARTH